MRFEVHLTNQAMARDPKLLQPAPTKENICAVVVTYFPDEGFPNRLSRTHMQVMHVVVVDNASDEETFKHVQTVLSETRIDVIRNSENLGIATALNQGVQWALNKGYKWVLLLDQDTVSSQDMVPTLIRAYEEFPDKGRLAIIGSNRFSNSDPDDRPSTNAEWWTVSKMVITSGTLLRLEAARMIGPFRDEFFIDCVDFEFCLRARIMGFRIVEILEPIMEHFIGSPKSVRLLWKKIETFNHRPWRLYYRMRNFVVLVREYVFEDSEWVLSELYAQIKSVTLTLLVEKSRIQKAKYMTLGLYDGFIGRFDRTVGRNAALSGKITDERNPQC
ncbi:MAG TPA: glycosyltransferase [Candidatus Acidoferrum sp.]|nr:glycosyltransferase [Candidatus Acidoferrum sp.]